VYINIDGFTTSYSGVGYGGGNATISTYDAPEEGDQVISDLSFSAEFENRLVFDADEDEYGIRLAGNDFNIQTGDKRFTFSSNGAFRLPAGGDILDSNGNSVLGGGSGGGVDGLTGDTSFTPAAEGDLKYLLDINGDIKLRTYQPGSGPNDFGPGILLGDGANRHRSGVVAIGIDDVGYNSKAKGVYIGYAAGWNDTENPQGENAIAIGAKAAYQFAYDRTITLNATGQELNPEQEDSLYIKPIREEQYDDIALYYNPTSGEVTYAANTGGAGVIISDTAPESGRLWFNSTEARMYIRYNEQWVDSSPTVLPPPDNNPTFESVTFNDATVQTTAWKGTFSYNDLTDKPITSMFVGGGNASSWLTAD
jgi:hypothetical protein